MQRARSSDGLTPLHLAARKGDLSVTELLIHHKADVRTLKSEHSRMDKRFRGLEGHANTAVFFPEGSVRGGKILEAADGWRYAVKHGLQGDLGQPEEVIGPRAVAVLMFLCWRW